MPSIGRYVGGTPYVLTGSGGVNITGITPASAQENISTSSGTQSVWRNGTQKNIGVPPLTETATGIFWTGNGLDEGTDYTTLVAAYDHSKNVDPGKTGSALAIAQNESACVWKAVSGPWDSRLNLLNWRQPVFFVPTQPAANSFPPAPNATSLASRLTEADVDYVSVPNETVAFSTPNPATVLQMWRWHWNDQDANRPQADRLTGEFQEPSFRRDAAKAAIDAMLCMCLNINADVKKALIDWTVIHAEDICGSLERGIRFNNPQTDGGVQNGRKMIVCVAAWLTGDSLFTHWANRTDWATEDAYCQYITQDHIDNFGDGVSGVTYGFLAGDIGTPWWFPGTASWGPSRAAIINREIRTLPGLTAINSWRSGYQEMFFAHMVGFKALCGLMTGLQTLWNNQAVFDWIDRMCRNTSYDGSGSTNAGLFSGGTNNATAFHVNMFNAYAPAAVWTW